MFETIFSNPYTLYGMIFVAALLLMDMTLRSVFARRRKDKQIKNRLQALKLRKGETTAYAELLKRRGLGGRDGTQSLGGYFNRIIGQSGLEISLFRRVLYLIGFTLLGFLIAPMLVGGNIVIRAGFAVVFGIGLGVGLVYYFRAKRIKTFTTQLAPAIDIIVRSLNAGHPLVAAIALVSREMPDPIGSEFGILNDQLTFGSSLEQGMLNMVDRVGADELNLLAVTVTVQRGTGGNLSEILENLAQMIRDRLMIKAKIRAISAEGRITSWIMLCFPFFLFFMLRTMVPTYFDIVWESGWGTVVVSGCLFLIFMGMIIIRRLVNFDF
ncbi:type II secretion system F family protein [Primorskyibacter aestuariivivens]|uniref:type II secretion system F family protein n=1 Tax=Primorskyibacter aestuariivivens TaxID=1888912 RepID=UPI00230069BB|nr:type II secretion system F family protein [Primorskyibacter aestuariivivens]MDA7427610.1 type II secretion system F family protein [Primorskyibacter aestuariivivens]